MICKVFVAPSARRDLDETKQFYDQISSSLGSYCQDALLTDISSLQFYAGIHVRVFGHYRLLSRRFPYAIYYQIVGAKAVVVAILDTRRNPKSMKKRLTHESLP